MTTTEAPLLPPPVVPDEALTPMLDDRERACELLLDDGERRCGRPAAWAVSADCDDCADGPKVALLCDPCKCSYLDNGIAMACGCGEIVTITWIEPLR